MTVDAVGPGRSTQSHLEELASRFTIGYKSIGEMVYGVIREAIVAGIYAPGERLRQEAIATAIGVSRIPVRSALLQLEAEGLVEMHPRRGAVVRALSLSQLREIYEIRELLEPHALRKSMKTMTPERLLRLRAMAMRLDKEHEGQEFLELRIAFYRDLYDAETNPELVKIIEELRATVGRYLLGWRVATSVTQSHTTIIQLVENGDVKAATAALTTHLKLVRHGLEERLAPTKQPTSAS